MTSTAPTTRSSERLTTVATFTLLGLAVIQGGYVMYRMNSKPVARASMLPPDTVDLRGKAFPQLAGLQPVKGSDAGREMAAPMTVVAFLNTNCSACESAKPTLEALKRKYGDKLGFVGIFSQPVNPVEKYSASYPKFSDEKKALALALKVHGTPTFYVLQGGKVQYQTVGWSSEVGTDLETLAKGGKL